MHALMSEIQSWPKKVEHLSGKITNKVVSPFWPWLYLDIMKVSRIIDLNRFNNVQNANSIKVPNFIYLIIVEIDLKDHSSLSKKLYLTIGNKSLISTNSWVLISKPNFQYLFLVSLPEMMFLRFSPKTINCKIWVKCLNHSSDGQYSSQWYTNVSRCSCLRSWVKILAIFFGDVQCNLIHRWRWHVNHLWLL